MDKQAAEEKHADAAATPAPEAKPHCGIIMPISDSPGYDPGHWLEVRRLIVRAAEQIGYTAEMVSENDGQDVIHRSIVKNIYHNELVVCDVSSLNPNVMLELGLRMANKKPLIIIFDGEGAYPFDIKNMLYIPYPKGLHHFKVENFVQELTARMLQVMGAYKAGKYEPFLNHYNDVTIETSTLGTTTQTIAEAFTSLAEEVKGIKLEINANSTRSSVLTARMLADINSSYAFSKDELELISKDVIYFYGIEKAKKAHPQMIAGNVVGHILSKVYDLKSPTHDANLAGLFASNHKHVHDIIGKIVRDIVASEAN